MGRTSKDDQAKRKRDRAKVKALLKPNPPREDPCKVATITAQAIILEPVDRTVTLYRALSPYDIANLQGIRKQCSETETCDPLIRGGSSAISAAYHIQMANDENVQSRTPWLSFTHDFRVAVANSICRENGTGVIGKFVFKCSELLGWQPEGQPGVFIHENSATKEGGNLANEWKEYICASGPQKKDDTKWSFPWWNSRRPVPISEDYEYAIKSRSSAPLCLSKDRTLDMVNVGNYTTGQNAANASREVVIYVGDQSLNTVFGGSKLKAVYQLRAEDFPVDRRVVARLNRYAAGRPKIETGLSQEGPSAQVLRHQGPFSMTFVWSGGACSKRFWIRDARKEWN